MKIVYIAGPYRGKDEYAVRLNKLAAEKLAVEVWRMGAMAFCPHKNSSELGGCVEDGVFLDGDAELLKRCDVVVTVGDWRQSIGAQAEVRLAERNEIPVFCDVPSLREWIHKNKERKR